jgi:hypothetical protein
LFSHESLGVSVFRTGNWLHGDRLVLTLSGPVHTGAGDLIAGEAGVGNPQQSDGYMGLRLSGRVYSTELSYFTPLSQDTGLGFSVSQRSSALRDYGAPDERMMSIRFSTRF